MRPHGPVFRRPRHAWAVAGFLHDGLDAGRHVLIVARPEALWNGLGRDESFELLCGYSAAHFTGANGRAMLRAICAQHGGVHQDQSDVLASWLLKTEQLA